MKTTGLQRVINCLKAEKRATEPSFQNFWKNTAQYSRCKRKFGVI